MVVSIATSYWAFEELIILAHAPGCGEELLQKSFPRAKFFPQRNANGFFWWDSELKVSNRPRRLRSIESAGVTECGQLYNYLSFSSLVDLRTVCNCSPVLDPGLKERMWIASWLSWTWWNKLIERNGKHKNSGHDRKLCGITLVWNC